MNSHTRAMLLSAALASCTPSVVPATKADLAVPVAATKAPEPSATHDDPRPVPAPSSECRLWNPPVEEDTEDKGHDQWLYGWAKIGEKETLLSYHRDPEAVKKAFPIGHRFSALTPQGPIWLERTGWAETTTPTMDGPAPLYLLVLGGDKQQAGSPALFLPRACTHGDPKLRPLTPEPNAPLQKALKAAGKHLGLDLKDSLTTVVRASVGNQATHVVNYYHPSNGSTHLYPESAAFTMKADGTVVDVLLKGETPTHSQSFPYAVDLEGDGIDELVHVRDIWEGEDEIHLIGWHDGKPRSVFIDFDDYRKLPSQP